MMRATYACPPRLPKDARRGLIKLLLRNKSFSLRQCKEMGKTRNMCVDSTGLFLIRRDIISVSRKSGAQILRATPRSMRDHAIAQKMVSVCFDQCRRREF